MDLREIRFRLLSVLESLLEFFQSARRSLRLLGGRRLSASAGSERERLPSSSDRSAEGVLGVRCFGRGGVDVGVGGFPLRPLLDGGGKSLSSGSRCFLPSSDDLFVVLGVLS